MVSKAIGLYISNVEKTKEQGMTHCKMLSALAFVAMACIACVGGPSGGPGETAAAGSSGNTGIAGTGGSSGGGTGGSSGGGQAGTGGASGASGMSASAGSAGASGASGVSGSGGAGISGAAGASGSSAGSGGSASDPCLGVTVGTSCSEWGACAHCGSLYCQGGTWTPESISTCGSSGAGGSAGSSGSGGVAGTAGASGSGAAGSSAGAAGSSAGSAGSSAGASGASGSAGVAGGSGASGSAGSTAGAAGSLTGGSGGMPGSLCPKLCGPGQVCTDQSGVALCVDASGAGGSAGTAGAAGMGNAAGASGASGSSGTSALRLFTFRHSMPVGVTADISIYDRAMDAQGNILLRPQPIGWGLTEAELKYAWGFAADSYPSPCSKSGVNQVSCPVHFPAGAVVQLSTNLMMLQGQSPTWSCPLTAFTGVTDVLDANNAPVSLTVINPADDVAGGGYCVFQFVVP